MEYRVDLRQDEMPRQWYNLVADLPTPLPPPLTGSGESLKPEDLAPVFPMNLIEQEMCTDRWVDIPQEVLGYLFRWRPTPLFRARSLEQALKTPARIYFKNESVSPAGSHKPNTAVAQAYYNRVAGIKRLTTETGAGQWGSALSFACALMGLECRVFMVRISFDQKPFRKLMMQTWGGPCVASPSQETGAGGNFLKAYPDSPGSLGLAISEAVEAAVTDPSGKTRYALGSVLNHVMLHQTIIGLEAEKQMAKIGEKRVDTLIGCVGGGSNFAGLTFPFLARKAAGAPVDVVAVEPESCPTLTRAPYVYDHGDTAKMTPLLAMHSLGHAFVPQSIHAGGLRYHGMAPLVSRALEDKLIRARSIPQLDSYRAALLFARTEGIIVAPETSHAVAAAIEEAEKAREAGEEKVILFNLSGHGLMDLVGYEKFLSGQLRNAPLTEEELQGTLSALEGFPKP